MSPAVLDPLQLTRNARTSLAAFIWMLRNNTLTSTESLDPILFTDNVTGRTFDFQLAATTSLMAQTDDDGVTWHPTQGGGIASGVGHQTVGGGPFLVWTALQAAATAAACAILTAPGPVASSPLSAYPNAAYYASQGIGTAQMALGQTDGFSFELALQRYSFTQRSGLYGHVKVGADGTVFIPNKSCTGTQGVVASQDNGLTFAVQKVPTARPVPATPARRWRKRPRLLQIYRWVGSSENRGVGRQWRDAA